MWIIIAGLALTSPLLLFYLTNESSILINKKNRKIIISEKSPPLVITFTDLISVDLIENDEEAILSSAKAKQKFFKKAKSAYLKITIANFDNPVYVCFTNNKTKKNSFEYQSAEKRAQVLYNKLSEIINLKSKSPNKNMTVKNSAELELKKLTEFKSNIARLSSS